MTRRERALSKARRLEAMAVRASIRATSRDNPIGREAIRSGQVADLRFRRAKQIQLAVEQQDAARQREKQKPKRQAKNWWKGSAA
jgi:hypothetical protein